MIRKKIDSLLKSFEKKIDTLNRIEISKSAIINNYQVYQQNNPNSCIFPVLKSNAYGHGLEQVVDILSDIKPEYICVDSYYEYLRIKSINSCQGVLIIGYTKPNNYKLFDFKYLAITVYDLESLKVLGDLNQKINIHLKIDTGMNRQGIFVDELPEFLSQLKKYQKLNLEGVLSHFADADTPDSDYTLEQVKVFKNALEFVKKFGFSPKFIHISNSAGGLSIDGSSFNSLRLGIGLYGYCPLLPNDLNFKKSKKLKPCLRLISTIVQTKNIKKGAKISYNLTYVAEKNKKIAIIPAGYYEGIDRRLSNIGNFTYNSQKNNKIDYKIPILGRICMNLTVCDITNLSLKSGDELVLIDNNPNSINSIENIAKLCNTIPYVVTTKLAESIRRIVVK
jgi:alanine racemase